MRRPARARWIFSNVALCKPRLAAASAVLERHAIHRLRRRAIAGLSRRTQKKAPNSRGSSESGSYVDEEAAYAEGGILGTGMALSDDDGDASRPGLTDLLTIGSNGHGYVRGDHGEVPLLAYAGSRKVFGSDNSESEEETTRPSITEQPGPSVLPPIPSLPSMPAMPMAFGSGAFPRPTASVRDVPSRAHGFSIVTPTGDPTASLSKRERRRLEREVLRLVPDGDAGLGEGRRGVRKRFVGEDEGGEAMDDDGGDEGARAGSEEGHVVGAGYVVGEEEWDSGDEESGSDGSEDGSEGMSGLSEEENGLDVAWPTLPGEMRIEDGIAEAAATTRDGGSLSVSMEASGANAELLRSASRGDVGGIEAALSQGADVGCWEEELGRTPLALACQGGHVAAVAALIERGADAYVFDNAARTPLMYAAEGGHEAVVALLLGARVQADAHALSQDGVTALGLAARGGHLGCMRLLLAKTDVGGGLHTGGADPNLCDEKTGHHALIDAARSGSAEAVRLLLAHRAKVNRADKRGVTAMFVAAEEGHAEALGALLDASGAKVDIFEYTTRCTPLMAAARQGHWECVTLLLGRGADPQLRNAQGLTAADLAINTCRDLF